MIAVRIRYRRRRCEQIDFGGALLGRMRRRSAQRRQDWQKVENGVEGVHIFSGRNEARRLMQHNRERRLCVQKFPVHFYAVSCRRLRAEVRANFAVNGNSTCGNKLIAITPRTNACGCEETIQAHPRM